MGRGTDGAETNKGKGGKGGRKSDGRKKGEKRKRKEEREWDKLGSILILPFPTFSLDQRS